jgi:ABC-type transport system involved in cytochrome bd biosynthesis fused ATPase/permease subunit
MLLHSPRLLLLDEPYASLDSEGAAVLDAEVAELAGRRTLVVATHDRERLADASTLEVALP